MELLIPSVELPAKGDLRVHTPLIPCKREWFLDRIGWNSALGIDRDGEGGLLMHRRHLPLVIAELVDRFGAVDLYREYRPEERCTGRCQRAEKPECTCSCAGEKHGAKSGHSWLDGHEAGNYLLIGTGVDDWSHTRITAETNP